MGRFVVGVVVGGDMVVGMLGFLDLGLSLLSSHFHKGREREREKDGQQSSKRSRRSKGQSQNHSSRFSHKPRWQNLQTVKKFNLALNHLDFITQGAICLYFEAHPFQFLA